MLFREFLVLVLLRHYYSFYFCTLLSQSIVKANKHKFVRTCSIVCNEISLPQIINKDNDQIYILVNKLPYLSAEEFVDYHNNHHAFLSCSLPYFL